MDSLYFGWLELIKLGIEFRKNGESAKEFQDLAQPQKWLDTSSYEIQKWENDGTPVNQGSLGYYHFSQIHMLSNLFIE